PMPSTLMQAGGCPPHPCDFGSTCLAECSVLRERRRSAVTRLSYRERLSEASMLICSSRPGPRPAATNGGSKKRVLAPRTHKADVGFEPGNVGSQIVLIRGLMFSTRFS